MERPLVHAHHHTRVDDGAAAAARMAAVDGRGKHRDAQDVEEALHVLHRHDHVYTRRPLQVVVVHPVFRRGCVNPSEFGVQGCGV